MKRTILIILSVFILILSLAGLTGFGAGASTVVLESKITDADYYDSAYTLKDNNDSFGYYKSFVFLNKSSSNPTVVTMKPDTKYNPHISFDINLDKPSTVYVWIRAKATEGGSVTSSDSIHWAFDGTMGSDYLMSNLAVDTDYLWIRVGAKRLSNGKHTLNFVGREKYLEISHVKIVNSAVTLVWDGSPYNNPTVFPPKNQHPRVLVNTETLPQVKANLNHPDNKYFLALHEEALDRAVDEASTAYNRNHPRKIQSLAFEYLINNDTEKGEEAIRLLKNRLETVQYASTDDYNTSGKFIYATAIVYDWCYDLLDESEREYLVEKNLELASIYSEMGWPPVNQNGFGGHGSENTLLKDLLALGIAAYDEFPDIYEVVAGRIFDEYVWPRQFYFTAHKSLYGTDYGVYRGKHDLNCSLLFKGIGYDDIWGTDEYAKTPYWYIYAKRPDGYYLEDGDGRENQSKGRFANYSPIYMQMGISSLYNDGYLKKAAKDELDFRMTNYKNYEILEEYLECLISNDVTLEESSIEELNLSKYFPYPSGSYIARTGWGEDSMLVSMKMNEVNISDHNHLDAGGFQIYYKGNLATDSGYYQSIYDDNAEGYNGTYFGDPYHQAYFRQTIAHNCMLVYDPNEPDSNFVSNTNLEKIDFKVNTGGQKSNSHDLSYPESAEEFKTSAHNTSKVLAHEHNEKVIDPDYTYIKGDLSGAYSSKVNAYERTFMFLNLKNEEVPGALIVLDHVVSKYATYKKTYLLHGVNAPSIDNENQRVTLVRDEKKVAPSTTVKEGYDYNGKLVNDVLLPKNATIKQVGEEKTDYYINDVKLRTVGGADGNEGVAEGGGIRTEISPSTNAKEDYFLNVMQVSDADSDNEPLEVVLVEGSDSHVGVIISDRVVMLGKAKDRYEENITFDFLGAGYYNISVDNLSSGKWYVYRNGMYLDTCTVTEDGGIAYFNGKAGEYLLTKTKKQVDLKLSVSSEFYPGLKSYENANAFMTFGKIDGFGLIGEIIDYGFIVNEGKNAEGKEYKISVMKNNYEPDSSGNMQFGIIFFGKAVNNFMPYSYKNYLVYSEDGVEHTVYSETRYDYIRNLGSYNKYPITEYMVNE